MIVTTKSPCSQPPGSAKNPHVFKAGIRWALLAKLKRKDGNPFDISGYTGRSELRVNPEDAGPPVAVWTVVPNSAFVGESLMMIGATVTATIAPGHYVFDLEYENDSNADDVIMGTKETHHVRVVAGVTKP